MTILDLWMDYMDKMKILNKYLVLVCPRQIRSSPIVPNSTEIIQGSLVGPIAVHFRVYFTYTGASGGLLSQNLAIFWTYFGILNNFSQFFLN